MGCMKLFSVLKKCRVHWNHLRLLKPERQLRIRKASKKFVQLPWCCTKAPVCVNSMPSLWIYKCIVGNNCYIYPPDGVSSNSQCSQCNADLLHLLSHKFPSINKKRILVDSWVLLKPVLTYWVERNDLVHLPCCCVVSQC